MEGTVLQLVTEFLIKYGTNDEAVAEYLATAVESGEEDLEHVESLVASLCPDFAELPEENRLGAILALTEQVQALNKPSSEATDAPGPSGPSITNVTSKLESSLQLSSSSTSSHKDSDTDQSSDQQAPVSALEELYPTVNPQYLQHVLHKCGSLEAAVEWLLDRGDSVEDDEAAWIEACAQEMAEAAEAEAVKKKMRGQLLSKFDLEVVPTVPTDKKKGKTPQLSTWAGPDEKQSKVRYRDGQMYNMGKGQKYVIEKLGEEWDGGSRGKVYTKGKRGKGFA